MCACAYIYIYIYIYLYIYIYVCVCVLCETDKESDHVPEREGVLLTKDT
jgi:hypothetical protein